MFTNPRILKTYINDMPDPVVAKNKISGTVNEANNADKSIWVYARDSGELLAHTMVDRETRKWEVYLDTAHNDESLFIICRDEGGDFNGDIFDYVSLCTVEYEPNSNMASLTEFPEETFVKEPVFPSTTMQYYKCTVPELKGDITKVSQNSENVLNYVDANNNIVSNGVTANNVLVNDSSIVLNKEINKYLKGNFLKTWRKNIFNDNSEVFHPVFNGKGWEDFYSKSPFLFSDGGHTSYAGRYGDMALAAERTNLDLSGAFDMPGVDAGFHKGASSALTISFHGLINGSSNGGWINATNIYEFNRFFSLCNPITNNVYFSIGSSVHGKDRSNVFYTTVGSSSVTTTVSDAMYNGNPFRLVGIWHHYVVVITTTNLKVYIDNILIVDRNFSNTSIPDDFIFIIGKTIKNAQYNSTYDIYLGGRISGLRVFNREVTVQEVETLYNDRPIIEQDVFSIKGMEYARWNTLLFSQDKSFLFLGGCPFAPLYEYFLYKETYQDGKETYCYASPEKYIDILSPGRSPLLRENYVTMSNVPEAREYNDYWTGLASRPDTATDQDMGVNMNDIEVEIRCRVRGAGHLFKIGNYNNGSLYIYKENTIGRFSYRFSNNTWGNLYYTQPANGWDSWIRVRWYENKLCVYEDDGTTLLGSATAYWNTFDNTLGQIAVGCRRGSDSQYSAPYDGYGVDGDISDVVIYKKGTMPSPERAEVVPPIEPVIYKEYKFGYERDGLAGLYLYETAEIEVANSIDGTSKVRAGTVDRGLTIRNWSTKAKDKNIKDISVIAYYNIDSDWYYSNTTDLYNNHYLIYHVYYNHNIGFSARYSPFYGMSNSVQAQASFVFDEWNMIAATIEGDSKLKALQSYTDGCRGIRVNNYNFNVRTNSGGDYYIHLESSSMDRNYCRLGAATERIYMYDMVLPPSVIRNLYQNFNSAVYKDDMQVAFIEDNNNYPIYKDVQITKITVKGKDNGQILTFAFTNNNEDYYIYSSGWKKIASTSGVAESEKWKVIATAMDNTANRMNIARVNSLTANQIAELYDATTGIFNVAVGMKSDGTISPYFEDIHFNTEKIWLSRLYNLSEFSHTSYITKTFLQRFIKDGQPSGLKLYSHVSGYDGWQEIQPFAPVPNINQGVQNNGTVQFKVTFDATKHDANENTFFEVLIK